jgi:hypothetical protein
MFSIGWLLAFWLISTGPIFAGATQAVARVQTAGPRLLACHDHRGSGVDKNVDVVQFSRLGCLPTFQYFQALDALPKPEYLRLRPKLKWDFEKTVLTRGDVTSGEESFDIVPDVRVVRQYGSSETLVIVHNDSSSPIFVEGYDIHQDECPTCIGSAYIAVAPHKSRWIYRIQAMIANPIWQPEQMRFSVMFAK